MILIGIDIGTSTICISAVESETGAVVQSTGRNNDACIASQNAWERMQDPERITDIAIGLISDYREKYAVKAIGIAGQMHGILYVDGSGSAVSPLYTWQDGRGNLAYDGETSYAEYMSARTGYRLATGYGFVTHFYHRANGMVPADAKYFCTIHDYLAMKLAGLRKPVMHSSDAASMGLFDLEALCFDGKALDALGLCDRCLPETVKDISVIGESSGGIPIVVPIGDNQAGVAGALKDMENSVLINVGTSSQISVCRSGFATARDIDVRPFTGDRYILVGAPLCGGKSYALLEEFFRKTVEMAGYSCTDEALYESMSALGRRHASLTDKLTVSTKFGGSRSAPSERGSICNMGLDNFTPEHFTVGILEGIAAELFENYVRIKEATDIKPKLLVGSGNGIRKNNALREILSGRFGLDLAVPVHMEEAAYGAALIATVAVGMYKSINEAQQIIRYL